MAVSPPNPRVSILIPNYNNGRASSRTGDRDLIGDLLESLEETLRNDQTPFEVLVVDDGSTDDSIDTLRHWAAEKVWPDGRPFLTLIEREHCGVLSVTANILSRRAQGEILVRLDGDVVCLTDDWVTKLCRVFDDGPPRLGVVGPKQLRVDGTIHSYGDHVLHPKGYHHIGGGLPRDAFRHAMEVDHVMGCFYCCRKAVYEELDGYDEEILRGQTVEFGLRARKAGWSCIVVPHIEFIHAHSQRKVRDTTADTDDGVNDSLDTFEEKWGFNRIAPDLDEVRRRYAGTPLLWNPRFSNPVPYLEPDPEGPIDLTQSDWTRVTQDEYFQQCCDWRTALILDTMRQGCINHNVVQLGCGVGVTGHLLAMNGATFIGFDRSKASIDLANRVVARQQYNSCPAPRFAVSNDLIAHGRADESADVVLIDCMMERHPNPVGLLKEARRLLVPGGFVIIFSRRVPPEVDPGTPTTEHFYRYEELLTQLLAVGGLELRTDPARDRTKPGPDMVVIGSRPGGTNAVEATPAEAVANA